MTPPDGRAEATVDDLAGELADEYARLITEALDSGRIKTAEEAHAVRREIIGSLLSVTLADRDSMRKEIEGLKLVIQGEQEARWKVEAAYRGKDEAVSKLMDMCQRRGIDLSGLIP